MIFSYAGSESSSSEMKSREKVLIH